MTAEPPRDWRSHLHARPPGDRRPRLDRLPRPRIGLLGGSFNPAHGGHLHVSREALKRLGLNEVWWLVAPQNPLKPVRGMAPFEERLAGAARLARDPRIRVLDLERRLGTRYTADTVAALRRLFPKTRFVWLMGADNLGQIRSWQRWTRIFAALPIAVFARPTYCFKGLAGLAARRYRARRVGSYAARGLADATPPAWAFLPVKLDVSSATEIRSLARSQGKARGRRSNVQGGDRHTPPQTRAASRRGSEARASRARREDA